MQHPKTYIIEEDEHLQNMRNIIKRDFFQKHSQQQIDQQTIKLSLNDYLSNFKSNQSQIFTQLVRSDVEEWKQKNKWMQKCTQLMIKSGQNQDKPYLNMIGKNQKIKAIDHSRTKQEIKNGVFFSPSRQTRSYQKNQHQQQKRVIYSNCYIDNPNVHQNTQYQSRTEQRQYELQQIPEEAVLQGRKKLKKESEDGKKYKIMRQPSPSPQKMPIMTWGQVQSTPQRIKQYRIPQIPKKDQILGQLNSKICHDKKIKKNRKDEVRMKILSSVRNDMSSVRIASMKRYESTKRAATAQQRQVQADKMDELLRFPNTNINTNTNINNNNNKNGN